MRIKEMRIRAGLTQLCIAEMMGVKQNTVSTWETGQCYPRSELLPALAYYLGCTIDDLFATKLQGEADRTA